MSRKITEESIHAFMYSTTKRFKKSNMEVDIDDGYVKMYLHGNAIARRRMGTLNIEITDAGWCTTTTKERLNGLPWVSISQKKWVWYLNGKALTNEDYERQGYGSRLKWTNVRDFA